MCGRRFVGDVGVVVVGSPFAVRCGNRSMGGAGGGLEEVTVQVQWFLLMHLLVLSSCTNDLLNPACMSQGW